MSLASTPASFNSALPFFSFSANIAVPSVCGIPQHTATQVNPKSAGFDVDPSVAELHDVASTASASAGNPMLIVDNAAAVNDLKTTFEAALFFDAEATTMGDDRRERCARVVDFDDVVVGARATESGARARVMMMRRVQL